CLVRPAPGRPDRDGDGRRQARRAARRGARQVRDRRAVRRHGRGRALRGCDPSTRGPRSEEEGDPVRTGPGVRRPRRPAGRRPLNRGPPAVGVAPTYSVMVMFLPMTLVTRCPMLPPTTCPPEPPVPV